MEVILLLIRLFLFGIFALAGIGKLFDPEGSEKAVADFGIPTPAAKPIAAVLPYAELAIAVSLLFISSSWLGAIAALLLLLVFIGGMLFQMAKGNAPDCHCFGQLHSEPVGTSSLVRNIVFALLAMFLAVQGSSYQGMSLGETDTGVLQTFLLLGVAAISTVIAILLKKSIEQQKQILRRIEILELLSNEGVPLERQSAGLPNEGLPIGSPFPDFELKSVGGKAWTLSSLRAPGLPLLCFFVSPTCEPCKGLMPQIEKWQAELAGKVELIMFSSGTPEENQAKFPAAFHDDILLQNEREVAERVRARWTPTALFVRGDGLVGSQLAAGDEAIRKLVEMISAADLTDRNLYFAEDTSGTRRLNIGAQVPQFSLPDSKGGKVTDSDLKSRKTLAVFWSLGCPHCAAMLNDLRKWDDSKNGSGPELVIFSDGDAEDHSDFELASPIALDDGHKISQKLGMLGTPSAVIIDESGTVVSETAIGSTNIWALVGRPD